MSIDKIDKNAEDNSDYVKETLPFPRAKFDGKVVDKINEIIDKLDTEFIILGAEICQHKYNLIFYKNTDKTSFGILCDNNLNYIYANSPLEGTNIFLKIIEPLLSNLEFPGMPKND